MNKRAPLFFFLAVLVVNGLVALIFWKTIRNAFIAPLSVFFMVVIDLISMFDQVYLWGFILFISVIFTMIKLGKTKSKEPITRNLRLKVNPVGRLRFWETQVYLLTRGRVPSRYSIHEVRRLMVAVIGYKIHLDEAETDRRLKSGELAIPPEFDTFAQFDQQTDEYEDLLTIISKTIKSILRGNRQKVIQAREKVLTDLILYMEKQMEIEHDH